MVNLIERTKTPLQPCGPSEFPVYSEVLTGITTLQSSSSELTRRFWHAASRPCSFFDPATNLGPEAIQEQTNDAMDKTRR